MSGKVDGSDKLKRKIPPAKTPVFITIIPNHSENEHNLENEFQVTENIRVRRSNVDAFWWSFANSFAKNSGKVCKN